MRSPLNPNSHGITQQQSSPPTVKALHPDLLWHLLADRYRNGMGTILTRPRLGSPLPLIRAGRTTVVPRLPLVSRASRCPTMHRTPEALDTVSDPATSVGNPKGGQATIHNYHNPAPTPLCGQVLRSPPDNTLRHDSILNERVSNNSLSVQEPLFVANYYLSCKNRRLMDPAPGSSLPYFVFHEGFDRALHTSVGHPRQTSGTKWHDSLCH